MLRVVSLKHEGEPGAAGPFDTVVLASDERHLRRKVLALSGGDKVMADFPEPVVLDDGDLLVLEDGRCAMVVAAEQELHDIRGRDASHLAELAWHIGNRHLPAQIEADRILVERDHVIRAMLEGLGAIVTDTREGFSPLRGAYSGGHSHGHSHSRSHEHDHD
jgi:urease accessory protein